MIRKIEKLIILAVFLVVSVCVSAQDGTYGAYSPYSVYGIGDISKEGTAYNKSMGGTGIATRNRRFINYLNPAAVKRGYGGRLLFCSESDFHLGTKRLGQSVKRNKVKPVCNQTAAILRAVFADDNGVVCGVDAVDKHRLSECAQTLALTDGIIDYTVMNAENIAVFVNLLIGILRISSGT